MARMGEALGSEDVEPKSVPGAEWSVQNNPKLDPHPSGEAIGTS
jgi:hypothetical protein